MLHVLWPRCLDFLGPHLGHAHPRVRYSAFQAVGQTAYDHDPYVAEMLEGEIGCWEGNSLVCWVHMQQTCNIFILVVQPPFDMKHLVDVYTIHLAL